MKHGCGVVLAFILLSISAAIIIGQRLSDQTIAALAGVVCGVGLAVPVGITFGMYVASTRQRNQATHTAPPQIIMIPTPPAQTTNPPMPSSAHVPMFPMPRSFTILGEGDTADSDG